MEASARRCGRLSPLLVLGAALWFGATSCASLVGARQGGLPSATPGTTFHALRSGGRTRTFLLHLPPPRFWTRRLPLVVLLHGSGASANVIMDETGMNARADSAGFAVAYPNGSGWLRYFDLTWNAGGCCGEALAGRVDDVGYLRDLISSLATALPIDSDRVYVAGFSDGGRMAYRAACDLSARVSAIAVVSGALPDTTCRPAHPVAVDIFHGTADTNIPYGAPGPVRRPRHRGDAPPSTVPETFAYWARWDGCGGPMSERVTGALVTQRYAACAGGAEVVLHTIVGGKHAWPGGRRGWFLEPRPSTAIDATSEMLAFFSRHGRGG